MDTKAFEFFLDTAKDKGENYDREWMIANAIVAQAIALEGIAASLEKLASVVNPGRDGTPCLQTIDTYQEWRGSNL